MESVNTYSIVMASLGALFILGAVVYKVWKYLRRR